MPETVSPQDLAKDITWDLSDLYRSLDDPALERDLTEALERAKKFEAKYRSQISPRPPAPDTLLAAFQEMESIREQADRAMSFVFLLFAADTQNPRHGAMMQKTQERLTELRKHLLFFELGVAALPDGPAEMLIADQRLARYRHVIEKLRTFHPYQLSEPEERIIDEKANTGVRAFGRLFDETISRMKFRLKEGGKIKELGEQEVLSLLYDSSRKRRRAAASALTDGLKANGPLLGYIFNVVVADHASEDRLRKLPDPMASRHLDNEVVPAAVEALLDACDRNVGTVARYYRLKKRLLRLDRLYDYDRYAPLKSSGALIDFESCRERVLTSFSAFSPKAHEIAKTFFERHWIDAALRPGKRGGAFCHATIPSVHPYVLVNYTGRPRDVMTVAHELGHGIHQSLSSAQGYLSADAPLTLAETASVFAEMLVFHRLKNEETDPKMRLILLCEKIEESIATAFRQSALTRFEQSVHKARREEGELSLERYNRIWLEVNRTMFGDSVDLTEDYGHWWMYISHFIHSPFYCYAYTFGHLLVLSLYQRYLSEGLSFVPRYLALLEGGGSDRPERLLQRTVGIDVARPEFWQEGLDLLSGMVDEAERLAGC
ncbi:MAG TPA: M3 family oligoendopeptidase [Nitrospiria bacterium]|nr:M3 family oligoendopeptidase [Nitrospiria bacterium]